MAICDVVIFQTRYEDVAVLTAFADRHTAVDVAIFGRNDHIDIPASYPRGIRFDQGPEARKVYLDELGNTPRAEFVVDTGNGSVALALHRFIITHPATIGYVPGTPGLFASLIRVNELKALRTLKEYPEVNGAFDTYISLFKQP